MLDSTSRYASQGSFLSIDLTTETSVCSSEAGQVATIAMCSGPVERLAYWDFLAEQGLGGRSLPEAHPQTSVFLVHHNGRPVGAGTLLPDSHLGLPLPELFMARIERLRHEGRHLALLDPLIITTDVSSHDAQLILQAILRLVLVTARRLDGRTDILIRCEPGPARFFAQSLLFSVEVEQPADATTPAQLLLRLDLDLCPSEWLHRYGDGPHSPFGLYIRPTPHAARTAGWLRQQRRSPSLNEVVDAWIAAVPPDRDAIAGLCRLYPGLSEHLIVHRRNSWSLQRPAIMPCPHPRICIPLPPAGCWSCPP